MPPNKWRTVSLPEDLLEEVEAILPKAHYATTSEFVRAAVREKLLQERMTLAARAAAAQEVASDA